MSYKLQKYLEFKKNISNKFRKKVKKIEKQYSQSQLNSIKSSPKSSRINIPVDIKNLPYQKILNLKL